MFQEQVQSQMKKLREPSPGAHHAFANLARGAVYLGEARSHAGVDALAIAQRVSGTYVSRMLLDEDVIFVLHG